MNIYNAAFQAKAKLEFQKVYSQYFVYDDKINPLKDAQFFKFIEGSTYSSKNNALSFTTYYYDWNGNISNSLIEEYTFTYNAENYPLIRSELHNSYTYNQIFQYE